MIQTERLSQSFSSEYNKKKQLRTYLHKFKPKVRNIIYRNAYPEKLSYYTEKTYDTYIEKTQDQMPEPVGVSGYSRDWASVLLNQTVLTNQREELAQDLIDHWVPRCYKSPFFKDDCLWMFQVHLTVPRNGFVDQGKRRRKNTKKAKL